MYIAVTYIGSRYVPGETISEDTPKEKLDWLKRAGAIREAAPDPEAPVMAEAPEETEEEPGGTDEPETPAAPDDEQEPETTEEEPQDEEPEDEIDEEAEAPEIDVMDGLVTAPAEEEKPARTAARKSAGKAAKGGKTK